MTSAQIASGLFRKGNVIMVSLFNIRINTRTTKKERNLEKVLSL